jgi:hypothetical protein
MVSHQESSVAGAPSWGGPAAAVAREKAVAWVTDYMRDTMESQEAAWVAFAEMMDRKNQLKERR